MIIDLNKLLYDSEIKINEKVSYTDEYLKNTDILKLNDINVVGRIYIDYEQNNVIHLDVNGTMYLTDAITLDEVPYEFTVEIEENLENSLKTLDLIEFLWHYIVLEIPIRYTTSDIEELKNIYQDVYEEKENTNNPFKDFFGE